jgi:hypothetical protein
MELASMKLDDFINCVDLFIQQNLSKAEREYGGNLLNANKFYSPGQKNQRYLFCIMQKLVQCGEYIRSLAIPL